MKRLSELPAAARTPEPCIVAAARPADAHGGAIAGVDTRYPAERHLQPLLTIVAAPALASAVPQPLYRKLAWRYWLLTVAAGAAMWWAILALF